MKTNVSRKIIDFSLYFIKGRRKHVVVITSFLVLIAAAPIALQIFDHVSGILELKDEYDSVKGAEIAKQEFDIKPGNNITLIVHEKNNDTLFQEKILDYISRLVSKINELNVEPVETVLLTEPPDKNDTIAWETYKYRWSREVSTDNTTAILQVEPIENEKVSNVYKGIKKILSQMKPPSNLEVGFVGTTPVLLELGDIIKKDIENMDKYVIPFIILVSWLIFRDIRKLLLIFFIVLFILITSMAIVVMFVGILKINALTPPIIMVASFGFGLDYTVLFLKRYEEISLDEKSTPENVVARTISSAGETVFISGFTMIIAFTSMFIPDFLFLRTLAFSLSVVILMSLVAVLIVLPSFLMIFFDGALKNARDIDPKTRLSRDERGYNHVARDNVKRGVSLDKLEHFWEKNSRWAIKHARTILIMSLLVFAPLLFMAVTINYSNNVNGLMPTSAEVVHFEKIYEEKFGTQDIEPVIIIIKTGIPNALFEDGGRLYTGLLYLAIKIRDMLNVTPASIISLNWISGSIVSYEAFKRMLTDNSTIARQYMQYIANFLDTNDDNDTTFMIVQFDEDPYSASVKRKIEILKNVILPNVPLIENYEKHVTGVNVFSFEMQDDLFGHVPIMLIYLIVVLNLFLYYMIGSFTVPLRISFTVFLTIGSIYGLAHLVLNSQMLRTLSPQLGSMDGLFWFVPVTTLPLMVGLGLDYDLFVVTRIKEERWMGSNETEATVKAIKSTGTVISFLALLMILSFSSLLFSSSLLLVQVGFCLTFTVFLDAFFVRTILVPVVMSMMHDKNWWPLKPP